MWEIGEVCGLLISLQAASKWGTSSPDRLGTLRHGADNCDLFREGQLGVEQSLFDLLSWGTMAAPRGRQW